MGYTIEVSSPSRQTVTQSVASYMHGNEYACLRVRSSFLHRIVHWKVLPITPHESGQIGFLVQKDEKCSEKYEKIIWRFLFFEKWSILYTKFFVNLVKYVTKNDQYFFFPKDAQCSEMNAKSIFRFVWFLFFRYMVDFALKILSELGNLTTASATFCESDSERLTIDNR